MKFHIESLETNNPLLEVIKATQLSDSMLEVKFSDGKINQIDFKEFLSRSSHPEIRKYLDQDLFSTFEVKDGNVIWNDYDLIFPLADLYSGKIS
jgi:hypothetical protein